MSDLCRLKVPYGPQSTANKAKKGKDKTVRIVKKLPQTNEDIFPEYNFKDELDAFKKKKSKVSENGFHMSDDDVSDVRRIAQEMEEKYGKSTCGTKKRRRGRRDDYADIGMGYDESDSFIDNTDGYDEIIPQNVTTLHGGFYINCGALEFKTDDKVDSPDEDESSSSSSSSSSEDEEENDKGKSSQNKKRPLESSSSEEDKEKDNTCEEKKVKVEANGMHNALKRKLFSHNKIHVKKKKDLEQSPNIQNTVKNLIMEKRKDLNLNLSIPGDVEIIAPDTNIKSYSDTIESVVKASEQAIEIKKSSQDSDVQLPENLPSNILDAVNRCRQVPLGVGSEIFTEEINNVLLSMERKCKCLGKPSKMKVYKYLSHYMKLDTNILTKHCNNLLLRDEEKKIKNLLHKLKKEIDSLMPNIIKNYEKDCDLVLQKRSMLQSQEGNKEKVTKIGRPKRKFQWNDQTRKLLKETATLRRRCFSLESKPKESWEDEMALFLKTKVLNLWPEGWMTIVSLTKVYNNLLNLKSPQENLKTVNNVTVTATNSKKENISAKSTASCNSNLSSNSANPASNHIKVNREIEITPINLNRLYQEDPKSMESKDNNSNVFNRSESEKISTKDIFPSQLTVAPVEHKNRASYQFDKYSDIKDFGPREPQVTFTPITNNKNLEREKSSPISFTDGDDIASVMENLKHLQKLSSPIKTSFDCGQRPTVLKHADSGVTFQEEFKRQMFNQVQVIPGSSKSNYKCS